MSQPVIKRRAEREPFDPSKLLPEATDASKFLNFVAFWLVERRDRRVKELPDHRLQITEMNSACADFSDWFYRRASDHERIEFRIRALKDAEDRKLARAAWRETERAALFPGDTHRG